MLGDSVTWGDRVGSGRNTRGCGAFGEGPRGEVPTDAPEIRSTAAVRETSFLCFERFNLGDGNSQRRVEEKGLTPFPAHFQDPSANAIYAPPTRTVPGASLDARPPGRRVSLRERPEILT